MDVIKKVTEIIEPSLDAMGYAIVQIKMADGARRKALTVMAERKDEKAMSFDDCAEISRMASVLLEVDDPIVVAYDLEVCSPGIDRPLTRLSDFVRFSGCDVKIETLIPMEGRKRFRGIIKGTKKEMILLQMPEGDVTIDFGAIRTAKLVPEIPAFTAGSGLQSKKKGKR